MKEKKKEKDTGTVAGAHLKQARDPIQIQIY